MNKNPVNLTDEELLALAEFMNADCGTMKDYLFDSVARKVLVAAAKAGLYDETD